MTTRPFSGFSTGRTEEPPFHETSTAPNGTWEPTRPIKQPTGGRTPVGQKDMGPTPCIVRSNRLLVLALLAATADDDLGDRLVVLVGGHRGLHALVADLGEHLVLQAVLNRVTRLKLLGVLVELALEHLDVVGDRQGLR